VEKDEEPTGALGREKGDRRTGEMWVAIKGGGGESMGRFWIKRTFASGKKSKLVNTAPWGGRWKV